MSMGTLIHISALWSYPWAVPAGIIMLTVMMEFVIVHHACRSYRVQYGWILSSFVRQWIKRTGQLLGLVAELLFTHPAHWQNTVRRWRENLKN